MSLWVIQTTYYTIPFSETRLALSINSLHNNETVFDHCINRFIYSFLKHRLFALSINVYARLCSTEFPRFCAQNTQCRHPNWLTGTEPKWLAKTHATSYI